MISIIIPTLDEERSLPVLLNAIGQQTAAHEVIVVDGGSQDRTLEVAHNHGVRTLISRPGRGAGIATGAEASCGDVLFFPSCRQQVASRSTRADQRSALDG